MNIIENYLKAVFFKDDQGLVSSAHKHILAVQNRNSPRAHWKIIIHCPACLYCSELPPTDINRQQAWCKTPGTHFYPAEITIRVYSFEFYTLAYGVEFVNCIFVFLNLNHRFQRVRTSRWLPLWNVLCVDVNFLRSR